MAGTENTEKHRIKSNLSQRNRMRWAVRSNITLAPQVDNYENPSSLELRTCWKQIS